MKDKKLFIIAGANGSDKTTLAKEVLPEYNLEFINADEVARSINPNDLQSVRVTAGKIVLRKLDDCMNKGISIAIESTLAGNFLLKHIKKAKDLGYQTAIIYVFLDNPQFNIERIRSRVRNGGHYIPDEDVIRRYRRSIFNFWNKYKDLSDVWKIYYNGGSDFLLVAKSISFEIEILDERLYNLFMENLINE
jgi:predicted ABC-type ATPase